MGEYSTIHGEILKKLATLTNFKNKKDLIDSLEILSLGLDINIIEGEAIEFHNWAEKTYIFPKEDVKDLDSIDELALLKHKWVNTWKPKQEVLSNGDYLTQLKTKIDEIIVGLIYR